MDKNTLYYTLSTIPQVIAAISAILAVFLFRRLESIKNLLIGDCRSILNRSNKGEYDFLLNMESSDRHDKNKQDLRLKDGISRKNHMEVKKVVLFYSNQEKKAEQKGITINKETGLQYVFGKFCKTEKLYNDLIKLSIVTLLVSILSILLSVICLSYADMIFSNCKSDLVILTNLILFIVAIFLTVCVVIKSFKKDTPHES